MQRVVILGAGPYAQMLRRYVDHDGDGVPVAFAVERAYLDRPEVEGLPLVALEDLPDRHAPSDVHVLPGIGYTRVNAVRSAIWAAASSRGYRFASYRAPSATVGPAAAIGAGTVLFEHVVVQSAARVGAGAIVWSGSCVNHDSVIGDFAFLASGVVVSGNVTIGDHAFLGAGAVVRDGVSIGPRAVIGAGATVMRDVPAGAVLSTQGTAARGDDSASLTAL